MGAGRLAFGADMRNSWRLIGKELGSAMGVLALLVLTLLMPLHATAEARVALGDRSGLMVLCLPDREAADPAKGAAAAVTCDLCILAHAAKAFGASPVVHVVAPQVFASVRPLPLPQDVDAGAMLVFLPDARGPPKV